MLSARLADRERERLWLLDCEPDRRWLTLRSCETLRRWLMLRALEPEAMAEADPERL